MKFRNIVSVLMASYMLGLMLLPCRDNCESGKHPQIITIESSGNHHEEENDICSPFCLCSCCAVSVVIQPVMEFKHHQLTSSQGFSLYSFSLFSEVRPSIWQPPKIS